MQHVLTFRSDTHKAELRKVCSEYSKCLDDLISKELTQTQKFSSVCIERAHKRAILQDLRLDEAKDRISITSDQRSVIGEAVIAYVEKSPGQSLSWEELDDLRLIIQELITMCDVEIATNNYLLEKKKNSNR